ncbi:WD40 repeat domain-containing protein [Novipirellula aureliae]|uniref:WD40 repeat domain-containing protein n=1 Tax=Novipirellula aureliae TaxID=2527966 RepID=UPI0018CCC61C|nr:WD40 repeat domain-containing protein [Novipirellula aureliae]
MKSYLFGGGPVTAVVIWLEHVDETRKQFRHLATTYDGTTIAFGEFKRVVHIVDLTTGARVSKFDTDLDFGGSRLAIDPNGAFCAIASYDNNSVTLADVHGKQIWQRTDVDEVQKVRFSLDGDTLFCSHHRGIVSQFDVRTGETIRFTWLKKDLYGAKDVIESPYDERLVIDQIERDIRITNQRFKHVATVKRKTFAVLDYAFAPEFMCISESGGPVTCYHLESGKEVWERPFMDGVHALDLRYNEDSKRFSAVTWPYENGGPFTLMSLGRHNGEIVTETLLPDAADFGFVNRGTRLILTTGQIVSATTGEQIGTLDISPDPAK